MGEVGVEQKLQDRLILHLTEMHRIGELDSLLRDNNCIRIKLSGDGTQVGRSVHVINFTFTFVDRDTAESVAGNHTLAILKTGEDYFNLVAGLQNIAEEVKNLSHVEIEGKQYQIEHHLSGNWQFLAIVYDLNVFGASVTLMTDRI